MEGRRIVISACLLGLNCNFTGRPNKKASVAFAPVISSGLKIGIHFIPVCPEQLGGLSTPRPPAEILSGASAGGKSHVVKTEHGEDVSGQFRLGASETLSIMKSLEAGVAVLKARSPSCGLDLVHSGNFDGKLISGNGVTADLLLRSGMQVFSDEEFLKEWHRQPGFDFLKEI